MKGRWRKLSLEQKNLLVMAIITLVVIAGFCSWKVWQRLNAIFVSAWEQSIGDSVFDVAFLPTGQLLGVLGYQSQKAVINLLRVTDGQIVRTFNNIGNAEHFAFSPDGQKLAIGILHPKGQFPGKISLLRVTDGQFVWKKRSHRVVAVAFSPDGRIIVSAGLDGTVCLWRADDGKLLRTLKVSQQLAPSSISLSPDGRFLAVGGTSLTVWRLDNGQLLCRLKPVLGKSFILATDFSPDGRYLISGTILDKPNETLSLWRVRDWTEIQKWQGHRGRIVWGVTSLDFSPDSYWLVSVGLDGRMKLWSMPDGKLVSEEKFGLVVDWQAFEAFRAINWRHVNWQYVKWFFSRLVRPRFGNRVAFSPDGKHIAVVLEPNRIGLFRVRLPKQ